MANTYELITSNTVGAGGVTDITFSSIQPNWTDLVVIASPRGSSASDRYAAYVQFNGSTSGYSDRVLYGQDSNATGSYSGDGGATQLGGTRFPGNTATANTFGSIQWYIPNAFGSNYKSVSMESVTENSSSTAWNIEMSAGLWSNTAAITSIKIICSTGSFAQYSTFYLYGVKNA